MCTMILSVHTNNTIIACVYVLLSSLSIANKINNKFSNTKSAINSISMNWTSINLITTSNNYNNRFSIISSSNKFNINKFTKSGQTSVQESNTFTILWFFKKEKKEKILYSLVQALLSQERIHFQIFCNNVSFSVIVLHRVGLPTESRYHTLQTNYITDNNVSMLIYIIFNTRRREQNDAIYSTF